MYGIGWSNLLWGNPLQLIMEGTKYLTCFNVVMNGIIPHYQFFVSTIPILPTHPTTPLLHYSNTPFFHYSTTPTLHYSTAGVNQDCWLLKYPWQFVAYQHAMWRSVGVLEYGSVGLKSGKISDFFFFHPCFPEIQTRFIFFHYPKHSPFQYSSTPDAINRLL